MNQAQTNETIGQGLETNVSKVKQKLIEAPRGSGYVAVSYRNWCGFLSNTCIQCITHVFTCIDQCIQNHDHDTCIRRVFAAYSCCINVSWTYPAPGSTRSAQVVEYNVSVVY